MTYSNDLLHSENLPPRFATREEIQSTAGCSICLSEAGAECVEEDGSPRGYSHKERQVAANRQKMLSWAKEDWESRRHEYLSFERTAYYEIVTSSFRRGASHLRLWLLAVSTEKDEMLIFGPFLSTDAAKSFYAVLKELEPTWEGFESIPLMNPATVWERL